LNLLQTFEQFFFRYTKFHYDGLRCKALGFIRQPQSLQCRRKSTTADSCRHGDRML
jgi:hypothetical protein